MKAPDVASSVDPAPTLGLLPAHLVAVCSPVQRVPAQCGCPKEGLQHPEEHVQNPAHIFRLSEKFRLILLLSSILICYFKQLDLFCGSNTAVQRWFSSSFKTSLLGLCNKYRQKQDCDWLNQWNKKEIKQKEH